MPRAKKPKPKPLPMLTPEIIDECLRKAPGIIREVEKSLAPFFVLPASVAGLRMGEGTPA